MRRLSSRCAHVFVAAAVSTLLSAPVAQAATIGSPLIDRTIRDYNIGGLFVYDLLLVPEGFQVVSWGFYSLNTSNPVSTSGVGNVITPLLFANTGGNNFEIIGIGTTRTNTNTGAQYFSFGLTSGTNIVGPNTYFGWRDGNISGSIVNDGSIELDYSGGPGLYYYPTNAPTTFSGVIAPGQAYLFTDNTTTARTYSVEVTTAPIPEPASMLLFGTGLIGLGAWRRRRR